MWWICGLGGQWRGHPYIDCVMSRQNGAGSKGADLLTLRCQKLQAEAEVIVGADGSQGVWAASACAGSACLDKQFCSRKVVVSS
jgi:hypothetical protein